MQVTHVNGPQDQEPVIQAGLHQKEAELSLRAAAGGSAGQSSGLLTRAEGEAGGTPEQPQVGGGGPTLGGPAGGTPWLPDWAALLERTVFRLEEDDPFAVGTRPSWREVRRLSAEIQARDLVLLGMLHQHRYLSSGQLRGLFWPGRGDRSVQRRLSELHGGLRLVTRWQQLAPRRRGSPARRPYVYLLTDRGAAVLAQAWGQDPKPAIRRAWRAAHFPARAHHDLAVADFFSGLAVAAAQWAGVGLYHWIGDDAMRRNHELVKGTLAPDGWGRLLLPNCEVLLNLEWDAGTEGNLPLSSKLRLYAEQLPPDEHVLVVAPHGPREQAIRQAVRYVLGGDAREFPLLTTTVTELRQDGLLAAVWSPIGDEESQISLLELPGSPRSELEVSHALAKPHWWVSRPGGGEGA